MPSPATTITVDFSQCSILDITASDIDDLPGLEVSPRLMLSEQFPEFDLKTLLQTTPMGNSVLNYYDTHNTLDNPRRICLVDMIVKHLYVYIIKK